MERHRVAGAIGFGRLILGALLQIPGRLASPHNRAATRGAATEFAKSFSVPAVEYDTRALGLGSAGTERIHHA
ncbi:hypothetical protein EZH22_14035 [Xanthobacter dioxanivorans]|uniref:Uncharacterized protein n=1 Tax=Xanthobacter dioxanivorans TaxID=2528964 RepID=A0A974PT55_9HYPH|nr:hypothetical protein [Xanthobacter dioxanivorans]QRG09272.1 hypothetical protein EZH22_14035 [Xanthobacter dioxanivorans]